MPDKELEILKDSIPLLAEAFSITRLAGGLTNKNYLLVTPSGRYVMRVSHPSSALLGINRQHEIVNTRRAFQAGVAPAVAFSALEENVLIVDWIEASTLHSPDFHLTPSLLARTALALKKLHNGPAFEGDFFFPYVRRKYSDTVLRYKYFMPDGYLDAEDKIAALERMLAEDPETKVPCNNDLLAENFMDDGSKIWIIDYEYSGQNEPSFEIGNLASESNFTTEQLTLFCDVYWGQQQPEKIARAMAWSLVARYGWVLWASIQEAVSDIEFDFRSWGSQKWNSVQQQLYNGYYENVVALLRGS